MLPKGIMFNSLDIAITLPLIMNSFDLQLMILPTDYFHLFYLFIFFWWGVGKDLPFMLRGIYIIGEWESLWSQDYELIMGVHYCYQFVEYGFRTCELFNHASIMTLSVTQLCKWCKSNMAIWIQ